MASLWEQKATETSIGTVGRRVIDVQPRFVKRDSERIDVRRLT